jgi:transcriptional repressor NrdR
MQCPTCQNTDSRVLESRSADTGKSVRRRRECLNCSFRFTTYERVETMPVSVIKKDGNRELFNKEKLFTGILRACEKTTFTREAIINFVDGIESQIIQDTNKDIKSSQIGELILKSLRKENEVAYIRYASVYRKFNGVKDFISTLESLQGKSKNQLASIL